MDKRKNWLLRLFFVLFTWSVAVTVIPSGIVNVQGLFGEVTSSMVTESGIVKEELSSGKIKKSEEVKGANIWNLWFETAALVACISFMAYRLRLPRGDTIVTLKVRMDN